MNLPPYVHGVFLELCWTSRCRTGFPILITQALFSYVWPVGSSSFLHDFQIIAQNKNSLLHVLGLFVAWDHVIHQKLEVLFFNSQRLSNEFLFTSGFNHVSNICALVSPVWAPFSLRKQNQNRIGIVFAFRLPSVRITPSTTSREFLCLLLWEL